MSYTMGIIHVSCVYLLVFLKKKQLHKSPTNVIHNGDNTCLLCLSSSVPKKETTTQKSYQVEKGNG